eukprot:COSAG03_NODE_29_length_18724_cov_58.310497_13_plen_641_part_00
MGGGRLRAGRERRSAPALWTVAACACVGMAGGLCSHDEFPQPPPFAEWDPSISRSDPKCTSEGCVENFDATAVCSRDHRAACLSERECSQTDDESECFCRCCCQYKPADWQCEWSKKNAGQPIRTPGNLHPGDVCTAVCQPGYAPKDPQTQSEKFTCSAATSTLEPPAQSAFECVEDKTLYCSTAPPCEGAGCEWADSCTEPGLMNGECKAQCQEGYISAGGMPSREVKYICKKVPGVNSGDWQVVGGQSPLQCLRECPESPPAPHQIWGSWGSSICSPPQTIGQCWAVCASGYHWAGAPAAQCDNMKGVSYTCTDGEWTGSSACQCTPAVCPATGDHLVPHGSGCAQSVYSSNQTISGCEIECRDGYTKLSGSGTYRCNTKGAWVPTSNQLVCTPACDQPLPFAHADMTNCTGLAGRALPIVDQRCAAQCAPGWVESGAGQYRCMTQSGNPSIPADWVWVGKYPEENFQCVLDKDAKPCKSNVPAKNMNVAKCNHTLAGAECKAQCDEGFQSNGGDSGFACDAAGRWVAKNLDPEGRLECSARVVPPAADWKPFVVAALVLMCLLCAIWTFDLCPVWCVDCLCPRPGHKPASVLRQSFLGGSHKMVRIVAKRRPTLSHLPPPPHLIRVLFCLIFLLLAT